MKKIMTLVVLGTTLFCTGVFAQKVNTDSLTLVSKISVNQVKLGKLQNEIEQKTTNKENAGDKAQASADENADAAKKLSDNPDDKRLARKANNKAGNAKTDARSARKEARRLVRLNNDIADLKNDIAKDQDKLNKLTGLTAQPMN